MRGVNLKSYWEKMPEYDRLIILKKNHLWDGLTLFPYKWIPEDLKDVLRREIASK
jgi:hypothetical protein